MTITNLGMQTWKAGQDEDGHRQYDASWLIQSTDPLDGPYTIGTSGVFASPGSVWAYGNDYDLWAFCSPVITITPKESDQPYCFWEVGQTWSTKPIEREQTDPPGNPLLEKPKISGSFVKYTKEAQTDRDGKPILSSSLERFKGKAVERDASRHTLQIKINSATLPLNTYRTYLDAVNDAPLWGLPKNTIKLSNITWEKNYFSTNWASVYYGITFDLDIDFDSYTRKILDEGTRTLRPGGNRYKVSDFRPFGGPVLLNGAGVAITNEAGQTFLEKEFYPERNLLSLSLPSTL